METRQNDARSRALLLVVDDREDNRLAIAEILERHGYAVLTAAGGAEALEQIRDHAPDLVICDLKMPDMDGLEVLRTARAMPDPPDFILLTAYATVETAVEAIHCGAFNYLTKPINPKELRAQVDRAVEQRLMRREVDRTRRQVDVVRNDQILAPGVIIESPAMRRLMQMVQRLGPSSSNVLIEGESGVGKEVVAQALHQAGGGDGRPFVAVHCAALPETLLESELFGYEKGAFTGAESRHIGRLELADGGTLFLDEVGEIPLAMQVKLLRVLEQKELTRIGGRQIIRVQFRLIAATNRNLEREVRAGRFREDLYYRLNVVRLVVPPLRERREDILPLFEAFLRRFAAEQGLPPPRLTTGVAQLLEAYDWPGNVRELRNLAERLSIFAAARDLTPEDLPFAQPAEGAAREEPMPAAAGASQTLADEEPLDLETLERRAIERALERFGGNRSAAAEALGISRRTLQRKLKEFRMVEEESGV